MAGYFRPGPEVPSQRIRLPGVKPHQVGAWRAFQGLLGYGPCRRICRYRLGGAE
jgi:hypothetical protein